MSSLKEMYDLRIVPPSTIGVVGLGAIGLPIAINLNNAGFTLKVHTRTREAEQSPFLKGSLPCSSPEAVAKDCEALLICVSDDMALDEVLFGLKGAVRKLKEGSIVINCSTISPAKAREHEKKLGQKRIGYIDAPVTGGTEGAKSGKLTILTGGETYHLDNVKEILSKIGKNIYHFGKVGLGQEVKAINQILVAGTYASVAEAIALAQELKLPMNLVLEALKNGAGGSWALENRSQSMLQRKYPLGFKLSLHKKDLNISLDMAKKLNIELPIAKKVRKMEDDLISLGYKDDDISSLREWFRTNNSY